MNTINIHEISPEIEIQSVQDTAMYLNLFHHETVEELLESYTDFTDFDIIAELADILNLNLIAVIEPTPEGMLLHGYINKAVAA